MITPAMQVTRMTMLRTVRREDSVQTVDEVVGFSVVGEAVKEVVARIEAEEAEEAEEEAVMVTRPRTQLEVEAQAIAVQTGQPNRRRRQATRLDRGATTRRCLV